jgi:predicted transcriptional regulator
LCLQIGSIYPATNFATLPDWQPWIIFFLKALRHQMKRLSAKVEKEKLLFSVLSSLELQILDYIKDHGRVSVGEMSVITGVSRNTLKPHFKSLVNAEHITLNGKGRGAWYSLV